MTMIPMRRRLFRATVGAVVGAAGMQRARAMMPARAALDSIGEIARLAFVNTHTGESVDVVYREGGQYLSDGLAEIDRVLRDHRSGDVHPIDHVLLDQLARLGRLLDTGARAFHVISGYRSPHTNATLAERSRGVATRSLHMEGRAIDIRLPGVPLAALHRTALAMHAGGVGLYTRSGFVHLDSGRVRSW